MCLFFHTHTLSVIWWTLNGVLLLVEGKISQTFSKVGMTFSSYPITDILLPTMSKADSRQDVLEEGGKGENSFPHLAVQHPWVILGQGSELRKRMTFLTSFHLRDPVMMASRKMRCAFIHTFKCILSIFCMLCCVPGTMKATLQYMKHDLYPQAIWSSSKGVI